MTALISLIPGKTRGHRPRLQSLVHLSRWIVRANRGIKTDRLTEPPPDLLPLKHCRNEKILIALTARTDLSQKLQRLAFRLHLERTQPIEYRRQAVARI